jgi:hypothetical protein
MTPSGELGAAIGGMTLIDLQSRLLELSRSLNDSPESGDPKAWTLAVPFMIPYQIA